MSELTQQLRKTDRIVRALILATCLILVVLAMATFVYVLQVDKKLETQIEHHRNETEETISRIERENERGHREQLQFIKCILFISREEPDRASAIEGCIDKAEGVSTESSNSSPNSTSETSPTTVNNDTQSEQPQPAPTPVAPAESTPTPTPTPDESAPAEPTIIERIETVIRGIL